MLCSVLSALLEWFHHGFYGMRCVKAALLGHLFCLPALPWGGRDVLGLLFLEEGCAQLAKLPTHHP